MPPKINLNKIGEEFNRDWSGKSRSVPLKKRKNKSSNHQNDEKRKAKQKVCRKSPGQRKTKRTKKLKPQKKKQRDPVACCFCDYAAEFIGELRKHCLAKHGRIWHGCRSCRISVPSSIERTEHLIICPFAATCDLCSKRMDNKSVLTYHLAQHYGEEFNWNKSIPCPKCGKLLKGSWSLENHIFRFHKELIDTLTQKLQCSLCNFRTPNAATLQRHEQTHDSHSRTRFVCFICGKSYAQSSYLKVHQKNRHASDEIKPYVCELCGKGFHIKVELVRHQGFKHSKGLKVKCPICDKGFMTQSSLDIHMVKHTGRREFYCPLCQKMFSQKCSVKRHLMKVHGVSAMPPIENEVLEKEEDAVEQLLPPCSTDNGPFGMSYFFKTESSGKISH